MTVRLGFGVCPKQQQAWTLLGLAPHQVRALTARSPACPEGGARVGPWVLAQGRGPSHRSRRNRLDVKQRHPRGRKVGGQAATKLENLLPCWASSKRGSEVQQEGCKLPRSSGHEFLHGSHMFQMQDMQRRRGSGAGTLGVPLEGTRRVGGLLGVAGRLSG